MKSILRSYLLVTAILTLFGTAQAHFSSRGPFGGSVKTLAVIGSNIYIGSNEGGVYYNQTTTFTGWRYVNYTGLGSGKISAIGGIDAKIVAATVDQGVYYSLNKGVAWARSNATLSGVNAFATLGSRIFAGTEANGIWVSADTGKTWASAGSFSGKVKALAVEGTTLYAGTDNGVSYSTDNGATWTSANTGLTTTAINALSISNGNIYAATNNGVFTATTSSISWTATTGLTNSTVNGLFSSGGVTYAATNGGVFSINDGAASWTAANAGYSGVVTSVAVYDNRLYLGTPDLGMYRSSSLSSINWVLFNTNFNNLESYTVYNNATLVIAATNKGLFVSRDLAANYSRANSGLSDSLNVIGLAFSGTKLYAATKNGGVFVTADTGRTWAAANTGLTNLSIKSIAAGTSSLVIVCSNGSAYSSPVSSISWTVGTGLPTITPSSLATDGTNFFLGTQGNGVYTSTNASSWSEFNTGLTNQAVTSVVVKGAWVYAGTSGNGVFRSAVSAANWVAANSGLPSLFITALAANDKWVAAGFKGGVYTTSNNATTWDEGGTQQYIPAYSDVIAISFGSTTTGSTRLFAATPKNALYSQSYNELETSTVTGLFDYNDEYSSMSTDVQVFPNPNTGTFRLQFEAGLNPAEIVISDYTGRPVKTISSNFDAQIAIEGTPGIYFVQVRSNKKTAVKKILIE